MTNSIFNINKSSLVCISKDIPSIYFFPISLQYRIYFVFLQRKKCLFDKMQMI